MSIDLVWAWNTLGIPGLVLAVLVPTVRAAFVVWRDTIVPSRLKLAERTVVAAERQAGAVEAIVDLCKLTRDDVAATRQDVGELRVGQARMQALQEAQASQPPRAARRLKVANAAAGDRS